MTTSSEYTQYILEFLEPIGPIRTGRFFGGIGISCHAVQFAMIMENRLYFAVNDDSRKQYERAGMPSFSYLTKRGRVQVCRYFELPEEVLTDREQLRRWAHEAMRVAEKPR